LDSGSVMLDISRYQTTGMRKI